MYFKSYITRCFLLGPPVPWLFPSLSFHSQLYRVLMRYINLDVASRSPLSATIVRSFRAPATSAQQIIRNMAVIYEYVERIPYVKIVPLSTHTYRFPPPSSFTSSGIAASSTTDRKFERGTKSEGRDRRGERQTNNATCFFPHSAI